MKSKILIIILIVDGIIVGLMLGYLLGQKTIKDEPIEINHSINLILPKNEQDLKKQILFNECQKTLLLTVERIKWYEKTGSNKPTTTK